MYHTFQRILAISRMEFGMPQATDDLREEWTDSTALEWLAGNFRWPDRMIRARKGYVPTEKDLRAITYMVTEWDFSWEGS
ncbi:hypothetical protein BLA17378_07991 [Burkholderia aenigmatica]|uniref:Uncharacterized protein n=1 Tax=Burkholderia aenigmatica TaxID=2015348 RepID=A0ABY6Y5M9_9BURK|nr:hypothetical protein [Burkholderia aenigmatica]VWD40277.1 hypothetical protein BLA17378_07991 [Burkholderia aenigmatica]